ncbi:MULTISPECIES: hypothetical protein [unclassified Carboxylicivirga]|uniref:hypothetical protein n=1 Tax=Carboxylicivirga TaxID=1628153 RepID=UPI003D341577
MAHCLYCHELLQGRSDKKYCSPYCKSAYHYQQHKHSEDTRFLVIDRQLKTNRRLLKAYNKAGKSVVRRAHIMDDGFDPRYHTHYWQAKNGNTYYFCYEYGFMASNEHGVDKYVLVQWQDYMKA